MKKEKLTNDQVLARRTYRSPNKFVYWGLRNLVLHPFLTPKYHITINKIDNINDCKGPCFLIYNHQSRVDYVWLCEATYPRRLNFMVGYNEHFRSHLYPISKFLRLIPKKNFTTDLTGIRGMNEVIKSGGCVCFSPEGMSSITGHNQPIVCGTGRMLKHYKVPVYALKSKGAFLMNHKVALDERYGKIDADIRVLLTPDQLASMSEEEIENRINEYLWQDDYEWNKVEKVTFKHKGTLCNHLHDLCYKCPKCGAELEMIGEGVTIKCNHCGNGATMSDKYELVPFNNECVIPESPSKWVQWERELVIHEIREKPDYSYSVHCKLGYLPPRGKIYHHDTSVTCGDGLFTVDHNGVHFKGTKLGKEFSFDMDYKQIWTLVVVTDVSFFSLYVNGEYHDFFPDVPSVGKILLIVEEMHRYHVNMWKNFPWMNHLYKETELEIKEENKAV